MKYSDIHKGIFLSRPNRFIAHVNINGAAEICHVKNTGRCKELLTAGTVIYVQKHDNPARKTKFSLIAAEKGKLLVNMDSQAPNKVVAEWLRQKEPFGKIKQLKPESKFANSRFDFYLETEAERYYIEVKGVTLEENGIAMFPDAPTERGVKHLQELISCLDFGYKAAVIFVIQFTGASYFTPNSRTHAEFAAVLKKAQQQGVQVLAVECTAEPDLLTITGTVPVKL